VLIDRSTQDEDMELNCETLPDLNPAMQFTDSVIAADADSANAVRLNSWVQSSAKRYVDVALVLAALPVLLPLALGIAAALRITSREPILFLQKRVGQNGTLFTMLKFRTMTTSEYKRGAITTIDDPTITRVGKFLRRWKLDELPQFINVLRGEMSLVGPRPKVPDQQIGVLVCLPGITGAATIAFAQEEAFLAGIPNGELEDYFRRVLLPLKNILDANYMAEATLLSDLRLIQRTALRRWSDVSMPDLLASALGDSGQCACSLDPLLKPDRTLPVAPRAVQPICKCSLLGPK
jgi:lipopolysaccharide/colanic/teichoic acid biosynthesis glycosyltransferase